MEEKKETISQAANVKETFETAKDLLDYVMNTEGNREQGQAIKAILTTKKHLFITGKAGCGKTTFMKRILPHIGPAAVVSPTGIAALNAGGVTIHSFFSFNLDPYAPIVEDGKLKNVETCRLNKDKRGVIKRLKVLIIDEMSMVRPDLLDRIADTLRQVRGNSVDSFGGVRLIMFGDLCQLPPVVKDGDVLYDYYDSKYFFASKSLRLAGFEVFEFKKVYRQRDESFVGILNSIRDNTISDEELSDLNKRVGVLPSGDIEYVTICSTNTEASAINLGRLVNIDSKSYFSKAEKWGDAPKDAMCEDVLEIKIGAQVLITKNGPGYVNGTVGVVSVIETNKKNDVMKIRVTIKDIDGKDIEVSLGRESWSKSVYLSTPSGIESDVVGEVIQFPVRLGYAITTHKSQGMSLDHAFVAMGNAFEGGQVYTALSRVRSLDGLYLKSEIKKEKIYIDSELEDFMKKCKENNGKFEPVPIEELKTKCDKDSFIDFEAFGL